jgi:NADPH:quinone reductase-like Zn-dependent oxidoreductase
MTVTQALFQVGEFTPGKSILWHAGASSISIAGIQLSKASGANPIFVTAGSQEKIDFCIRELGATAGFNYRTQDWAREILSATNGRGVDIVIDFVGANYFQGNLDVAARDARIVHLARLSGGALPPGVNMSEFLEKRVRFEGSTLRSRDVEYQRRLRDKLQEYLPKFEHGEFKLFIERVMPWEKIGEAHNFMEENKSMGKIVCTVS